MPFCENCGNKVSDQTKFCAKCGTKLNQEVFAFNPIQHVLPNRQKQLPAKKSGFSKYLLVLAVAVIAFIYFKGNAGNNYDSNGYKHGDWVEYINDDGSQEVPKESAKLIRHITYSHGMSVGLVKDCYPNGNIQSEFNLASQPYTRNGVRPIDKIFGYAVFFDEQTSKINGFTYFDDNGEINFEKTLGIAYEKARNDQRYDNEFFSKTEFGLFFLQNNNPNAFKNATDNHSNQATESFYNEDNGNYQQSKSQKVTCYKCNGTGRKICDKCFGKGVAKCGTCNGTGKFNAGRGLETCYYCNGKLMIPCNECGATGWKGSCYECGGKGYNYQ